MAFGAAEWRKYFGDVGVEPPLPPAIGNVLNNPCPFWPGKKIHETHLLVLVPQTVNGQPLTLKSLGELVKKPLQGHASKYGGFFLGRYTDPPAPRSHWALVTRNVIEGSRNKNYQKQQAVLAGYNQKAHMSYVVPKILDVTVAIFMEHVRSGIKLYGDSYLTYTKCQQSYNAEWELVVGGFSAYGLRVCDDFHLDDAYGVGGSLEVLGDG
jgi:hypothetical protein